MPTKQKPPPGLRPIGTEFWGEPYSSMISSDSALKRMLWRVIGYDETDKGPTETIKSVRSQRQECVGCNLPYASWKDRIFDGVWKDY